MNEDSHRWQQEDIDQMSCHKEADGKLINFNQLINTHQNVHRMQSINRNEFNYMYKVRKVNWMLSWSIECAHVINHFHALTKTLKCVSFAPNHLFHLHHHRKRDSVLISLGFSLVLELKDFFSIIKRFSFAYFLLWAIRRVENTKTNSFDVYWGWAIISVRETNDLLLIFSTVMGAREK